MNLKTRLDTLNVEIKMIEQLKDTQAIEAFFRRHPILFALASIWMGGAWVLKACLWTLLLLVAVVGVKLLWLAVQYMWALV